MIFLVMFSCSRECNFAYLHYIKFLANDSASSLQAAATSLKGGSRTTLQSTQLEPQAGRASAATISPVSLSPQSSTQSFCLRDDHKLLSHILQPTGMANGLSPGVREENTQH